MGLYHYNPESPLTRWQQEKVYALCGERHPILERRWLGKERPTDRALLRHIEREIDWYQLKEYAPTHAYYRARLRETNRLIRKIRNALCDRGRERGRPHLGTCKSHFEAPPTT